MSSAQASSGSSVTLAAIVAVLAVGAWWWRAAIIQRQPTKLERESWEHVQERYPSLEHEAVVPSLSPEVFDAVVQANPFSPKRRAVAPPAPSGQEGLEVAATKPGKPQFVYKGRIALGSRQRAILEDLSAKKTHFLEVGQEVAGFKVLDIEETRVILSDSRTNEEVVLSIAASSSP